MIEFLVDVERQLPKVRENEDFANEAALCLFLCPRVLESVQADATIVDRVTACAKVLDDGERLSEEHTAVGQMISAQNELDSLHETRRALVRTTAGLIGSCAFRDASTPPCE